MFGSILHRTILLELIKVFALSLIGIMSILVMAGIVAEASQQGMKPNQILGAIPLLIPSFLPYTIPATTLFATCVVYGRLAHDNEIVAIKSAGINPLKVIWPGLLLGLVMSGTTMALYYRLIPYTHRLLRSRILNDVEEYLYDMLKRDGCIKERRLPYAIYVRQVQGTRLLDALFKRFDKNGRYDVIARAAEAELRFDLQHHEVLVHMRRGEVLGGADGMKRGYFGEETWKVPLPLDSGVAAPKPRAMSCAEILERRRELAAERHELMARIERHRAQTSKPSTAPDVADLANQRKNRQQELAALDTELQMRPALSCGCLCFVLVGCPIGIWFSRSDYLSAFITCFLPVVFVYYPLLLCSSGYARQGFPAALVWTADGMMVLAGLALFRQLLKH